MSVGPLWDYAVALYAREGVKTALLALQHRRDADVDLLLFCCWCAASGRGALDDAGLGRLDEALAPWRESVTRALRRVRDAIGKHGRLAVLPGAADVREGVLRVELDAERVTIDRLQEMAPAAAGSRTDPATAAATSLGSYCRRLGFVPDATDEAALGVLLEAAFGKPVQAAPLRALRAAAAPPGR